MPAAQVLHVRNLPPDATEQDIQQLCKPFGRVVRIRLNAGAIKHQAFVEFETVNNAMQMIYSFVGSADPPKVQELCAGSHCQQVQPAGVAIG
jgi:polypyrimidine tract-binding protein 2